MNFAIMEGLPFCVEKTNLHEISDIIGIFREYHKNVSDSLRFYIYFQWTEDGQCFHIQHLTLDT